MANLRLFNINRIQITGRITKDIELKYTPKGTSTVQFSIANDRNYKDQDGSWLTETLFVNIQAWGAIAEMLSKNARKGSPVLIEGRLNCRKWESQDGKQNQAWEIVAENISVLEWLPKEEQPEPEFVPATADNVPF